MVIAFASQRGGVGKSTMVTNMASHFAACVEPRVGPVQVLDLDPQKIALSFAASLGELGVSVEFPDALEDVRARVAALPRGGVMLIDTPPTIGEEITIALAVADVIVVPLTGQPSLTGARDIQQTIEATQRRRSKIKVLYVLNRQKGRTVHYIEMQEKVRAALGAQVLEATVSDSVLWDEAMAECCPMMVWAPEHAAAREIRAVGDEMWRIINGTSN